MTKKKKEKDSKRSVFSILKTKAGKKVSAEEKSEKPEKTDKSEREKSEEALKELPGFPELVKRLRHEASGVPLKERSWRHRKYENCFLGKDAIDWFMNNSFSNNREYSCEIGKRLIEESVIVISWKRNRIQGRKFL